MGLAGSVLQPLPLSPAMLYLAIGFVLGPSGFGLVHIDPYAHAGLLTVITEIALLISLFAVGLRLRIELTNRIWWLPVRLGLLGMLVTIFLLSLVGVYLLDMPPAMAQTTPVMMVVM